MALPTKWFEYPIRVQPHHTDYGGVVWHGTYVTWLESARVECLRAASVPFEALTSSGYDLPVVDLALRYRQPLTLGAQAVVKTRLAPIEGIRLIWEYEIETVEAHPQQCLTGTVTLVTVNMTTRKVVRRWPPDVQAVVSKLESYFGAIE